MKLWSEGVRVFKGINDFKVYHFASTVIKRINFSSKDKMNLKSKGNKTFLLKWGMSTKFFKKFYLKTNSKYNGPLIIPKKNLSFLTSLLLCKLHYFYIKLFYSNTLFKGLTIMKVLILGSNGLLGNTLSLFF